MPGNSTSANALALSQENRRCRSCQGQISRMALPAACLVGGKLIAGGQYDPAGQSVTLATELPDGEARHEPTAKPVSTGQGNALAFIATGTQVRHLASDGRA